MLSASRCYLTTLESAMAGFRRDEALASSPRCRGHKTPVWRSPGAASWPLPRDLHAVSSGPGTPGHPNHLGTALATRFDDRPPMRSLTPCSSAVAEPRSSELRFSRGRDGRAMSRGPLADARPRSSATAAPPSHLVDGVLHGRHGSPAPAGERSGTVPLRSRVQDDEASLPRCTWPPRAKVCLPAAWEYGTAVMVRTRWPRSDGQVSFMGRTPFLAMLANRSRADRHISTAVSRAGSRRGGGCEGEVPTDRAVDRFSTPVITSRSIRSMSPSRASRVDAEVL